MSRLKKILSLGLCLVMLISLPSVPTYAGGSSGGSEPEIGFEYQLKPGMEEWGELNHGERVLASQIPAEELTGMSTKELVNVVLEYPCFMDMIFYNSYQEGFEVVRDNFNGLQELLKRDDVSSNLIDIYRNKNLTEIMTLNNEDDKFEKSLELLYLETMLAQPEVTNNLSDQDMAELSELVDYNYEMQKENPDQSASLSLSAYYESLAQQQGVEIYDSIGTVKTPNGSSVSVIIRTGVDTAYNNRAAVKRSIEKNYPGVSVVGDATIKYNCHAYAWAGSTSVWMNDPSKYWGDGSYKLKSTDSPSAVGQKAYYPGSGNEHSGNVVRKSGNQIRSKWGEQSVVEHSVGNCPYFFIPLSVKFYGR